VLFLYENRLQVPPYLFSNFLTLLGMNVTPKLSQLKQLEHIKNDSHFFHITIVSVNSYDEQTIMFLTDACNN